MLKLLNNSAFRQNVSFLTYRDVCVKFAEVKIQVCGFFPQKRSLQFGNMTPVAQITRLPSYRSKPRTQFWVTDETSEVSIHV